jgi:DNA-binding Lrp family transcriptional regulator
MIEYWKASSKTILDHFGLEAPPIPTRLRMIDSIQAERFGGQYNIPTEELLITQEVIENDVPLEGVVYRECLFHALPSDFCVAAQHDIASCFARIMLDRDNGERWISQWKMIPSQRIRANLEYDSFELMDWMYNLGGYDELTTLIHEIESMDKYGKKLTFEEYVEYMIKRTQDIIVGLSQTEVKIITAIQKDANVSHRQVSEQTGLSESWISTKVNQLKNRYVLVELTTTPFSRIGIRTFHVLLSGSSGDNPTRFIKNCPFLYNIRPILNGPWQVISRLAVPDNIENIKSLDQMVSILQRYGIAVDLSETYSVGINNSFYHYSIKNNHWDIPWVAMESWGYRIQSESLHQLIEPIDFPAKTTDHYLDEIDMDILELAHNGDASTRTLRKKLSIGQNQLSGRVKILRDEELIRKVWAVYNIGLNERVALRTHDKATSHMLDAWARELPRSYLRYEENRNLLLMTELPSGGSIKLMDALRKLKWPVTVAPIGSGVWGQWEFPKNLWDVDRQRWTSPHPQLVDWLNGITDECEGVVDSPTNTRRHFLKTR